MLTLVLKNTLIVEFVKPPKIQKYNGCRVRNAKVPSNARTEMTKKRSILEKSRFNCQKK